MYQASQQFIDLVKERNNILMVSHHKPDGDTLGSSLAFAHYLESINKSYRHFCVDRPVSYYEYLPKISQMIHDKSLINLDDFDLVICFDHGSLGQSGQAAELKQYKERDENIRLINIDHHFSNEKFGDLNILDFEASSTSECLYNIFKDTGIAISKNMATCLMTGLIYDTSTFTNSATQHSSLTCASDLVACGASIPDISDSVIKTKNLPSLNLWGEIFSRLTIHPERQIAYAIVRLSDLEQDGIKPEALDGLANFLQGLREIKAVMILIEEPDGMVKGSLRTTREDVDVNEIAKAWGGGGHKKAAGFKTTKEVMMAAGFWS